MSLTSHRELPPWDLLTLARDAYTPTMLELAAIFMSEPTKPRWRYALAEETGFSPTGVGGCVDRMMAAGWLLRAQQDPNAPRPRGQRGTPRVYYITTELGRDEMRRLLIYVHRLANMMRRTRNFGGAGHDAVRAPYERTSL